MKVRASAHAHAHTHTALRHRDVRQVCKNWKQLIVFLKGKSIAQFAISDSILVHVYNIS